jgi:transcriptional regulator GlxA family with amidase domain
LKPNDLRVRRILHLLRQKLDRPIHISELAGRVLLSKSRLFYLIRQETASSPAKLLKRMRMLAAKEMLVTTDLRVKEVAARVGFNDISHFVRDFETLFGLSPARYRRMAQSAAPLNHEQQASASEKNN